MIKEEDKKRVAWGITGSGDKISETVETMKEVRNQFQEKVAISVYLSKAAEQVLKYYRLMDELKMSFGNISSEVNANSPFLAGALQLRRFEFLLIAPATSNTVAKISMGIADTLISNSAIMALKSFVPVYILPSDYMEGTIVTKLPNNSNLKLRIRKEDVDNTRKLANMEDMTVLEKPEEIIKIFTKYFINAKTKQ
ncbi:archaeoflavoprotein AfpA [Candidatus Bathyarchaeota archaeon]|nr:archaeoflavoprotein AfpA [Candidatus Bathyarchaeota archaeon]